MDTKRVVSPGAEKWLNVVQHILNDGEVGLVDYQGTEEQLVGIARISHGKIFPHTEPPAAQKLINYFMEHKHTSPFEFVDLTWRWRLPIFVARQVIRHRTASVNEKSARYSELDCETYIPDPDRVQGQDTKNKQGSVGVLDEMIRESFVAACEHTQEESRDRYQKFLQRGVAKELARINLSLGTYTDWVWKMDLHNFFHFLALRLDSHAQYEVRIYAEAMWKVIKDAYPMCANAFTEYQLESVTFSKSEMSTLRYLLSGGQIGSYTEEESKILRKAGIQEGS